ncbi:MAG: thiolase family protein [Bacteroidia bacterium]|nr:thiolase family protein [Bacteroidia bacterium]MCC7532384.1 thiolase family protein [Bacteroidia bacterium]
MKQVKSIAKEASIPYGTWGTSYFPAWQSSPLAEVNIGQFAGEAMARILSKRGVSSTHLDYLMIGSTVPWHWKFWNATVVASCLGRRIPGFHVEQACATGLQAVVLAAFQVQSGASEAVGVLTFDRTSDSPASIFPERRAYRRTEVISDVWDNFGFDPSTESAMISSAGNVARKHKIDRNEIDELTAFRYQQYFEGKESGFLQRVALPLEILNVQGKTMGMIAEDIGVKKVSLESLRAMRDLDTCVTGGTQTHAADGMATLLVTTVEKAKEISTRPEINISFVAKAEVRVLPASMPEAPALAVKKLLIQTGLTMEDMVVVKDHNPFAVNDAVFSKVMGYDWHKMNNNGSPLVWGHPQGPTLTRVIIEALEEAVDLGGGYVLVFGCAAGDVGIAAIFKVNDKK